VDTAEERHLVARHDRMMHSVHVRYPREFGLAGVMGRHLDRVDDEHGREPAWLMLDRRQAHGLSNRIAERGALALLVASRLLGARRHEHAVAAHRVPHAEDGAVGPRDARHATDPFLMGDDSNSDRGRLSALEERYENKTSDGGNGLGHREWRRTEARAQSGPRHRIELHTFCSLQYRDKSCVEEKRLIEVQST
jgi:hypothetical protein